MGERRQTPRLDGDLGGPYLTGGQERDFPILESPCISQTQGQDMMAYSLNFTAVPLQPGSRPTVSRSLSCLR